MALPPLIYLTDADVRAAMPPVGERLDLARRVLTSLVADADLPSKVGVQPRPSAAFTAAMPALLRGADSDGSADLMGIKWVTAFPDNAAAGLPAIHATVVLNDAATGVPLAILDGVGITAQRTAAVSGVALREFWPHDVANPVVALVGAGVQGHSHVQVLEEVGAGARLIVVARHADHAEALAADARASGHFAEASAATDPAAAARAADVVLTMIPFGSHRQILPVDAFARVRLIVSVDYDMCVPASVAAGARQFLTDDVAQLRAAHHGEVFAGYRDPDGSLGEALLGRLPAPPDGDGPVLVNHLGVGLADVVFADAIVRRARASGLGTKLPR
jgi:ornithine cyclodeaminase/alanine dehydrogenase-like protein (mu-crystallin family)